MQCIRNLLFAFNALFALSGIIIIVCGGYSLYWFKKTGPVIEGSYVAAPVMLIVIGSIVFIVASLGCWGAVNRSYCMLMLFSVLLFLILVVEIAAGALGFVYKGKVQEIGEHELKRTMADYNRTSDKANPVKIAWDFMQRNLACCGTDGPGDWAGYIPDSCCKAGGDECKAEEAYPEGCFTLLKGKLKSYGIYIGVAGILLGLIEVTGIIFACCLSKHT